MAGRVGKENGGAFASRADSASSAYPFFSHTACPYFPCHKGLAPENFNCLFCYCPLYALGDACGGRFRYNDKGVKVCTDCFLPHVRDEGTRMVYDRFSELKDLARPSAVSMSEESASKGASAVWEHYIEVGQKRLRCGYTTGTCAAAATRAAAEALFAGAFPVAVTIEVPAGFDIRVEVECAEAGLGWARCAVRKFSGDDPDATDGALVFACVTRTEASGVAVDGGEGVGRVTRPGLDQPVGAAAINRVPREMIAREALAAQRAAGANGGISVTVSVPEGERIARKTFNPRLGIEGGISILGTTGVVRPMSEEALIASIQLEMRMRRAAGRRGLLLVPGNYGRDFTHGDLGIDFSECVQCSNYLGAALDYAVQAGFESILLVGHAGKLVKLAAGAMNTHSRCVDGRGEVLAAHAARLGASPDAVARIMDCVTVDEAIGILDEQGIRSEVMASIAQRMTYHLRKRVGSRVRAELVFFSSAYGSLGESDGARDLARTAFPHPDADGGLDACDDAAGKDGA